MTKKKPSVFLEHILESIKNIESFSFGLSKTGFEKDRLKQSAIIREIEIIGEAGKNITEKFREKHPEVPWSKMAKTRDKLIHGYFGVDLDLTWDIVKSNLPDLKKKIKKIIEDIEKESI